MRVVEPPTGLAVEVAALEAQLHFDGDETGTIAALIEAATDVIETATNRPILSRVVEITLPAGRWNTFWLPCAPAVGLIDAPGATLLTGLDEPRLVRGDFEGDSVQVRVGYGPSASDTPPRLRQAIILLVREWREFGLTVEQAVSTPQLSFGFRHLLRQSRYKRPQVVC